MEAEWNEKIKWWSVFEIDLRKGKDMAAIKGVITEIGRKKLCEAHAGTTPLSPIIQMGWGDGGVEADGSPKLLTGQETELFNELMRKDVDAPGYVNDSHTTCRYAATLESDDLVGKEISEVALYDSEGDMVMIQTFLRKGKDEGIPHKYEVDEIF